VFLETIAFTGFGLACLALYAGAKALDDRDRRQDEKNETGAPPPSSSIDLTASFATGSPEVRGSDRPLDRFSRPSAEPEPLVVS